MKNELNTITIDEDNLDRLACFNTNMTIKNSKIDYLEFDGGHLLVNNNSRIKTFHVINPREKVDPCQTSPNITIGRCKITNLLLDGYKIYIERGANIDYILVSSIFFGGMDSTGYVFINGCNINIDTIKSLPKSKVDIAKGNVNNIFAWGEVIVSSAARINNIELFDDDACVFVPLYFDWPKVKPVIKKITGKKGKICINGDVTIESMDISTAVDVAIAIDLTVIIKELIVDGKKINDITQYIKDHNVYYIYGPDCIEHLNEEN